MSTFYKRDGTKYPKGNKGLFQWGRDLEDFNKKVVKQETINGYWISTVWLGMDHSFLPDEKILIFETMVFDRRDNKKSFDELDMDRYSTEEEALKGHKRIVKKYKLKKKKYTKGKLYVN